MQISRNNKNRFDIGSVQDEKGIAGFHGGICGVIGWIAAKIFRTAVQVKINNKVYYLNCKSLENWRKRTAPSVAKGDMRDPKAVKTMMKQVIASRKMVSLEETKPVKQVPYKSQFPENKPKVKVKDLQEQKPRWSVGPEIRKHVAESESKAEVKDLQEQKPSWTLGISTDYIDCPEAQSERPSWSVGAGIRKHVAERATRDHRMPIVNNNNNNNFIGNTITSNGRTFHGVNSVVEENGRTWVDGREITSPSGPDLWDI